MITFTVHLSHCMVHLNPIIDHKSYKAKLNLKLLKYYSNPQHYYPYCLSNYKIIINFIKIYIYNLGSAFDYNKIYIIGILLDLQAMLIAKPLSLFRLTYSCYSFISNLKTIHIYDDYS